MNPHDPNPQRDGRAFVFRYSGARAGWLTKLLALSAIVAVLGLLLLLVLGLWVVFVIGAAVVAVAAVVSALIPRRPREKHPGQGRMLEGEARRLDVDD
jgi:Flp pilus assembly protein TadB